MLDWFRRRRKRRILVRSEADRLLVVHGKEAWGMVFARCRDRCLAAQKRRLAYAIRRVIEKRLAVPQLVDTATRYLDP